MRVEPARSSVHRLAPVALSALGIFGALLTIFAGLVALNHTVLPFNGWPRDAERLVTGRQVLPRAPVEASGRLRTAPGGAPAGASASSHAALPVAIVEPRTVSLVGLTLQRGTTHAAAPTVIRAPVQQPSAPAPQPSPAPAPAPVAASAPVPAPAPVVVSTPPVSRAPSKSSTAPSGPGGGHGRGRENAPGQLKKAIARPAAAGSPTAPAAPAPPAPPVSPAGEGDSPGNSGNAPGHADGHGPPPWAHGHH